LPGEEEVRPFLAKYCYECHGISDEASDLNLMTVAEGAGGWVQQQEVLADVLWVVEEGEMPPKKSEPQPGEAERFAAAEHLASMIDAIASQHENDPGRVIMPRLTKAEYNRVMRDLTGVEMEPARFFPNDSLAGEGFANVGEAQGTSMGEIERFLVAAETTTHHLGASVSEGLTWFDQPLTSVGTREELINRLKLQIVDWYGNIREDYIGRHVDALKEEFGRPHVPYLQAAWEYRFRAELGRPDESIEQVARRWDPELRPEILEHWLESLEAENAHGHLQFAVERWRDLPSPDETTPEEVRAEIDDIMEEWEPIHRYYSLGYRPPKYEKKVEDLRDGQREGYQPYEIDLGPKSEMADAEYLYLIATDAFETNDGDVIIWKQPRFLTEDGKEEPARKLGSFELVDVEGNSVDQPAFGSHPTGLSLEDESVAVQAPAMLRIAIPENAERFSVDAVLDERIEGHRSVQTAVRKEAPEYASHLRFLPGMRPWGGGDNPSLGRVYTEYYKVRNPLIAKGEKLELGKNVERNLIEPFLEIDPKHLGGPWKKQSEFKERDFDPYNLSFEYLRTHIATEKQQAQLGRMHRMLEESADPIRQELLTLLNEQGVEVEGGSWEVPIADLQSWPAEREERYRELTHLLELQNRQAEVRARELIRDWTTRAWRRAPTDDEVEQLTHLFSEAQRDGALFENAMRLPLIATLVSPHFLYRYQTAKGIEEAYALRDEELASRLSFFLWGSLPDAELLQSAAEGRLSNPKVMKQQVDRMLRDPRIDYLAVEFAGRWLQFAGFEDFTGPDTDRFEAFTPTLREAMYQEARMFFLDLFQQDRPVTDILDADYTYVNAELAEHYGMPGVDGETMRKVSTEGTVRGGVLGMGAVLTRYSEPLRTSPVRRGHWIYENLMGYPMPEPPANVPMISPDDVDEEGLSVRAQLVMHREDPSCASCHNKIDPLGIALENFDPVGGWRVEDSAGQPVDAVETTHDGTELDGFESLRAYLAESRDAFVRNFCEKLLGFSLGRAVVLSDLPLLEEMEEELSKNDYRFSAALTPILESPQFLQRRDERPQQEKIARNEN